MKLSMIVFIREGTGVMRVLSEGLEKGLLLFCVFGVLEREKVISFLYGLLFSSYFVGHDFRENAEVRCCFDDAFRPHCFFCHFGLDSLFWRVTIELSHLPSLEGIQRLIGIDEALLQVLLLDEFDDVLQGGVHIRLPTLQSSYDARETPTN